MRTAQETREQMYVATILSLEQSIDWSVKHLENWTQPKRLPPDKDIYDRVISYLVEKGYQISHDEDRWCISVGW